MITESTPDVLSFDVWKTLIRSNPEFKPARNQLVADMVGFNDVDHLTAVTREVDVALDNQSDITGVQYGPNQRLGRIFSALGLSVPDDQIETVATAAQNLFLEYPLQLNEPGLVETLTSLKDKYRGMCIASNTGFIDGFYMRKALEAVGIFDLMDAAFFSNEHGCAKPSADFFGLVIKWAETSPDQIIHIGDNPQADFEGARRLGMRAVLLETDPVTQTDSAPTVSSALESGLI